MSIFRKLGWFFKQEKRSYTIGITALIVVAFLQLIPPKVIGIIIDTIAAGKLQIQSVLFWVVILVLAAVGQYVFRFIWRTHIWGSAARLEKDLRRQLFDHFTRMDHVFYQETSHWIYGLAASHQ